MSEKQTVDDAGRERAWQKGLAMLERIGLERYVTVQTEGTDPATWRPSGVKPGQLPYVGFNKHSLLVDDQDGLTIYEYNGTTRCIRLDGWVEVSGARFGRVEISDATRIVDHVIARVDGTTSHTITFEGGGVLGYLLGSDGKIVELTYRDMLFAYTPTDNLIVTGSCFPHMRFRRQNDPPTRT